MTQPSTVVAAVAGLVEAIEPADRRTATDVFRYVPTFMDELESASSMDRTFTINSIALDEYTDLGCTVWDITAEIHILYAMTSHGIADALGGLARVLDDARSVALALRSSTDLSYVTDYQAIGSDTSADDGAIVHSRSFRIRYMEN